MIEKTPLVSIGLPVYNGEKYLKQAIDSILAQTFTDFELVICDNCSTDSTQEICLEYAARDPRVRYHRNEKNIGGGNNHHLVFKLSRGKYFRWAADDDLFHPELLDRCVSILNSDPSVVLCYPADVEIDAEGNYIKTTVPNRGISSNPYIRFKQIANHNHGCEESYGLMRSEILANAVIQDRYPGADRVLLAELSFSGPFYQIDEPLYYKRKHLRNAYIHYQGRMAWYKPTISGGFVCPYWMELRDYLRIISKAKIAYQDKLKCYMYLFGPWLRQNGKDLLKDIYFVMKMQLHSKNYREKFWAATDNWSKGN